MVNADAVGRTGTPFRMDIERGKIREFAAATGAEHPVYQQENPPIPPTFLTTAAFWSTADNKVWDAVALDQQRGLHAEQEFIFHGPPPRAGDRLTATSRIDDIYRKQGRRGGDLTFAVMITEFRDQAGKLVAESRMTGVETGQPPSPIGESGQIEQSRRTGEQS